MSVILACAIIAACSACSPKEDTSAYKWRDEWTEPEPQTPQIPDGPDNPGLPEIKGKPRYIWIDAAANFDDYGNSRENIRKDGI